MHVMMEQNTNSMVSATDPNRQNPKVVQCTDHKLRQASSGWTGRKAARTSFVELHVMQEIAGNLTHELYHHSAAKYSR
jgi:hypothetical protein